jgi:hypothetical protein
METPKAFSRTFPYPPPCFTSNENTQYNPPMTNTLALRYEGARSGVPDKDTIDATARAFEI